MTTIYKNTCEKCGYTIESTSKPLVYRGPDEIARTVELRKTYACRYAKWVKDKHHFDCMVESYTKRAKEANEKYSSVGIIHTVWTNISNDYVELLCNEEIIETDRRSTYKPMKKTLEHKYIKCGICGYRRIVTTSIVRVDKEE